MPPKGGNAKKESGRAKKAENEVKKKEAAAAEQERQEEKKWAEGSKVDKQADAKAKQEAAAARKAEAARLLAEEEANIGTSKPKAVKGPKPVKKTTLPTADSIDASEASGKGKGKAAEPEPEAPVAGTSLDGMVESFSASNLDDALDLLDNVVHAKTDKAGVGSAANSLERHPERRFKAAYEAYMERELPELRKDRPGLRLQQYKDLMFKSFQKSPDNPFNQTVVSYDATKEEKIGALKKRQEEVQERLREKKGLESS